MDDSTWVSVRNAPNLDVIDSTFHSFQVTDTNDNPPLFSEPAYSFDIPENAPRGYQVGLISASDPDLGANSMLTYTVISDWANDVFSLNLQTGVFTLTARLDYEEVSNSCFRNVFSSSKPADNHPIEWLKKKSFHRLERLRDLRLRLWDERERKNILKLDKTEEK